MTATTSHIANNELFQRVECRYDDVNAYINLLIRNRCGFWVCRRHASTRVIFDNVVNIFVSPGTGFDSKSLFIFSGVAKDASTYLARNRLNEDITAYPVNYKNRHFIGNLSELYRTDLNHAYWRIAYNKGIISPTIYEKGKAFKSTSLAGLAVLGKPRAYDRYERGKLTGADQIGGNTGLKKLYDMIRLTCFSYMNEAATELGQDFYCWKTDEIQYRGKHNIGIVHGLFKKHSLSFKTKSNAESVAVA